MSVQTKKFEKKKVKNKITKKACTTTRQNNLVCERIIFLKEKNEQAKKTKVKRHFHFQEDHTKFVFQSLLSIMVEKNKIPIYKSKPIKNWH